MVGEVGWSREWLIGGRLKSSHWAEVLPKVLQNPVWCVSFSVCSCGLSTLVVVALDVFVQINMEDMKLELQNSYIFLKEPGENSGKNLETYLNELFDTLKKTGHGIDLLNLFKRTYSGKIKIGRKERRVMFMLHLVGDTYYVDVIVQGKTRSDVVNTLEYVHSVICESNVSSDYTVIISYDAISEYYCNQMFPKLNELERNLRKLMYNIYTVNFGKDYYKATISEEIQNKAKGIIRASGSKKKKETEYIQKMFYSLEYGDVEHLLFNKKWTELDESNKTAFLESHTNLLELSDQTLRNAITNIAPKSDWERFFSDKIGATDIEGMIETIRKIRNNVAHCKFLYKDEYEKCSKCATELNQAILKAITITEEKDFADKNAETIFNNLKTCLYVFSKAVSTIGKMVMNFSEVGSVLASAFSEYTSMDLQLSNSNSNGDSTSEEIEVDSNENDSE